MCLEKQLKMKDFKKELKKGIGYKTFRWTFQGMRIRLDGEVFGLTKPRPMYKWLNERDFDIFPKRRTILDDQNQSYRKGWHIWLKPVEFCYKVRFKEPVALGEQRGLVVVAKKMYIVGRYKEKEKK